MITVRYFLFLNVICMAFWSSDLFAQDQRQVEAYLRAMERATQRTIDLVREEFSAVMDNDELDLFNDSLL